jgi:threonine synthase
MTTSSDLFLAPGARSIQRCASCLAVLDALDPAPACPACGGLLEIIHGAPVDAAGTPLTGHALRNTFAQHCCARPLGSPSGVWRFESLVMPGAGDAIVSHPEGNTPLLTRAAIDRFVGHEGLRIKHEGHNPTGSFKDRGMTAGVTQAVRIGARAVACASTGNTSAALASYAAQAGIPGLVFVPAGKIALGKLAQTLGYGARTLLVRGDFDACLRLVQDASRELGIYLLNSINPWRVEGQKTIVLEALQQLGWEAPDFIVLPAGNLGNTAAFGKALREVHAPGLIDRMPRLCPCRRPVRHRSRAAFARIATRHTVAAEGDRDGHSHRGSRVVGSRGACYSRDRWSGAVVYRRRDHQAKVAIDVAGVGCEPASAASVAGVRQPVRKR